MQDGIAFRLDVLYGRCKTPSTDDQKELYTVLCLISLFDVIDHQLYPIYPNGT